MAFPTVRNRTETSGGSASTTLTINFGTNVAGDLCVIFLGTNDTARAITTTESFIDYTNTNATFHVLYKILDGTEGTSTNVTVAASTKFAAIAYTIQQGTFASNIAPAISTVATGTSTAPNATSCAPTGSAKDYLWISAFRQNGEEADDDTWCTAAPSTPGTFTNLLQVTSGTASTANTNGSVASAEYTANATSVDAGAFTTAQSLAWRAYTIAIYPIMSGSFTANAAIKGTLSGSFTAAAIEQKAYSGSLAADAIRQRTYSWSVTADAEINAGVQTKFGSVSADSAFLRTQPGSFSADAIRLLAQSGTFSADAIERYIATGSLSSDAIALLTQSGQFSADAIRLLTTQGLFAADAIRLKTSESGITSDATFGSPTNTVYGDFDADAITTLVGACIWTYPTDGDPITSTPEMRFLMPYAANELYFWLELDKVDTFDGVNLRQYKTTDDLTGWSYWDGGSWQSITSAGVANTYAGNEARFIVSEPLNGGTWYRRVRAGTR